MTFINWWETWDNDSCIDDDQINDLMDYIQHSACTDFTIHSTCTSTGQAFRFTQLGGLSLLYGGDTTGDDMKLFSNDIDSCPYLYLQGDSDISAFVGYEHAFTVSSCSDEEWLRVDMHGVYFKGVDITTGGGGSATCPTRGDLPFTLWNDCDTQDEQGFQFSISGAKSTLTGGDDAGDDLWIYSNSSDSCPYIEMNGDADVTINIPWDTGFFEVSTCSAESLLKIDVSDPSDPYINFNCLNAKELRIENRTSDPSGPTCTGRIWFRTDLV